MLSQGKLRQALPILEKISKKKPRDAENWANLGFVYGELGAYDRAEPCLKKSLKLVSKAEYTFRVHRALGSLYEGRGEHREALMHYKKAIELNPDQDQIYLNLGNCLKHERCIDEAIDAYQHALSLDPDNYLACRNIGQIYEQSHQLEESRKYAELALKYAPNDVGTNFLIAQLDLREKKVDQAKDRLTNVLKLNMPSQHYALVAKELGRVLEKEGDYGAAFKLLNDANRRFRTLYIENKYESGLVEYRAEIEAYREAFSRDVITDWSNQEFITTDLKIVFLVGFPRSGTTLTEQIIEAHPDFIATHEIPVLPRLTRDVATVIKRPFSYPEDIDGLNNNEVVLLRAAYIQRMEESLNYAIDTGKFLLDKLPLNIIHLGFIARVFPEARVLVALRDPRDVCLSCYTQTFNDNQAMRQFLDIDDTARFYACVMGLWLYYKKLLDIEVLETRYEDIVDNLELAAKRILAFIGVDWCDDVMNFHDSAKKRQVFTPSYQSVTQPIYRGAINKWKNYEQELASILPILETYVREFGYDVDI